MSITNPHDPISQDQVVMMSEGYPTSASQYGYWNGLTKREHFAAIALQGILASPDYSRELAAAGHDYSVADYMHHVAGQAVRHADRLIRALNAIPPDTEAR